MATDKFKNFYVNDVSPANGGFSITPTDSDNCTRVTRAVYVGGAGDLKITFANNETVTFVGLVAGQTYPFRVKKVFSTGTSATNIIGLD